MPRRGQASITIPKWVWEKAKEYYEAHKEELKYQGIKSPTGLIVRWILDSLSESSQESPDK